MLFFMPIFLYLPLKPVYDYFLGKNEKIKSFSRKKLKVDNDVIKQVFDIKSQDLVIFNGKYK